jgi:hypothetical protein
VSDEPARLLQQADGWLFLRSEAVPERWRHRAVSVNLIALLPHELTELLDGGSVQPAIDAATEGVARLAARGLTVAAMARELGISTRSVDRHLARLRDLFGSGSTTELTAELARRGF